MEKNDFLKELKLKRGFFECDCQDVVDLRLLYRNLITLVTKEKNLNFGMLPINSRWRIAYFSDEEEVFPNELTDTKKEENKESDEVNNKLLQNPPKVTTSGRPLSRNQRSKAPTEKKSSNARKRQNSTSRSRSELKKMKK